MLLRQQSYAIKNQLVAKILLAGSLWHNTWGIVGFHAWKDPITRDGNAQTESIMSANENAVLNYLTNSVFFLPTQSSEKSSRLFSRNLEIYTAENFGIFLPVFRQSPTWTDKDGFIKYWQNQSVKMPILSNIFMTWGRVRSKISECKWTSLTVHLLQYWASLVSTGVIKNQLGHPRPPVRGFDHDNKT